MTQSKRTSPPKLAEDRNVTAITEPADSKIETVDEPKAKATRSRKSSTAAQAASATVAATVVSVTEESKTSRASSSSKSKASTGAASQQTVVDVVDPEKLASDEDVSPEVTSLSDQDEIDRMIAEAAYYIAEKRNFEPGHEEEDWASAREEVLSLLRGGSF